uniref:uncharacterized protein LOC117717969 n=1 Tax=Arvicanthis niloticus TaxID=61156 RepID=UPI0014876022|nr:uncharacterized protein LOC117717969 [Arvicanthis niloticus]
MFAASSRLWSAGGAAAPVQVRAGVEVTGLCCAVLEQTHTARGGAAAPVQVRTGVEVTGLCCVVLEQTHTARGGAAARVQVRAGVEVTGLCCAVLEQTHTARGGAAARVQVRAGVEVTGLCCAVLEQTHTARGAALQYLETYVSPSHTEHLQTRSPGMMGYMVVHGWSALCLSPQTAAAHIPLPEGGLLPLYPLLRTAGCLSCLQQVLNAGHWAAVLQSNSWQSDWCQATQKIPEDHTPVPQKTADGNNWGPNGCWG